MTRRALEITRTDRRAATAGPATPGRRRAGDDATAAAARRGAYDSVPADWQRVIAALRATDEDDLPLFGRVPG